MIAKSPVTSYRFSPDVAWIEADIGGGAAHTIWVSNLETGVQYELQDTGWLTWLLLSDGYNEVHRLHSELQSIHAELDPDGTTSAITEDALLDFLAVLHRDGLIVHA